MPIEIINGRPRSIRTDDEASEEIIKQFDSMTREEQEAFLAVLGGVERGEFDHLDSLINVEYETEPVDPLTFLLDDYYLGAVGNSMWPSLQKDFVDLFEGGYCEAILGGSLGWGKCLRSFSFFTDARTGERINIGQAVGTLPLVSSFDGQSIVTRQANQIWESGRKACAKLVLASGQWLEASLDHPVLGPWGYVPLGKLRQGDFVAVARKIPSPLEPFSISNEEVIVIAALLADGGMTAENTIYSKTDTRLRDDVVRCASTLPGFDGKGRETEGFVNLKGLKSWSDSWEIRTLSKVKRVPSKIFGLSNDQLALFIRWLFTDGSVYVNAPRKIEITLASEGLIDDLQYLLRRFGIVARKSYKKTKNQDGEFDAWRLQIADAPNQIAFIENVGFIPGKEDACERLLAKARLIRSNTNWDVVPITNEELKEIRKETGPHNNKTWMRLADQTNVAHMSRERFKKLCKTTNYQGRFRRFAELDDVVWERVVSVEETGVHDVYDLSVPETGNAIVNGMIVHNSFFATCGLAYIIYQMSCLANPQEVYGLAPGSGLAIAILSVTREAARRVPMDELAAKIRLSPYFKERMPFKVAQTMYEIRFPAKRIMVIAGSTASAAIGTNVFAGFLDEMAFMGDSRQLDRNGKMIETDRSEQLSKAIIRRMKSRFQRSGRLPGIMFLVSSKEKPVAFIEKRIAEASKTNDTSVFVREYATWDVKPKDNFSGETFRVAIGNDRVRSKIDPSSAEIDWYKDQGLQVIDVPEDYRRDFESDLEGSLRDVAGIATETVSPFIHRVEKISSAIDDTLPRVIDVDEWVAGQPLTFLWERVATQQEVPLPGGYKEMVWRPKRHPGSGRYAHIDPALTSDSAGIVIAHIGGWLEVVRRDNQGAEYTELAPVIETDFVLRVVPPSGDEIFLGDLRWILYQFVEHGFMISYVSMDSYQSADTMQQLRKRGIEAEVLSVDKSPDPYEVIKSAFYEDRIRMHRNEIVLREFVQLQRLPHATSSKFKIDHPKKGSKDIADALAGVVYSLTQRLPGRPMAPVIAQRKSIGVELPDHSWVTEGRVMVATSDGTLPPSRSTMGGTRSKEPIMPFVRG